MANPIEDLPGEIWKPIEGLEGCYEISTMGRVKNVKRGQLVRGSSRPKKRYVYVNVGGRVAAVHRLVLQAFVGPCPEGSCGCHNNGDGGDNRLTNLRWATFRENEADKWRHGRIKFGERNHNAKLSDAQRIEIVRLHKSGLAKYAIAKRYRVDQKTVASVIRMMAGRIGVAIAAKQA